MEQRNANGLSKTDIQDLIASLGRVIKRAAKYGDKDLVAAATAKRDRLQNELARA
jgi:hypothetical protein